MREAAKEIHQRIMKTKEQIIKLLDEWELHKINIDDAYHTLRELLGAELDSPLVSSMYNLFDSHTKTLSDLLCDDDDWLSWYAWDNELGEKELPAKASNWKEVKPIKSTSDLADLILNI